MNTMRKTKLNYSRPRNDCQLSSQIMTVHIMRTEIASESTNNCQVLECPNAHIERWQENWQMHCWCIACYGKRHNILLQMTDSSTWSITTVTDKKHRDLQGTSATCVNFNAKILTHFRLKTATILCQTATRQESITFHSHKEKHNT